MAYAFDTLGYAQMLEDAGVERAQAAAHAKAARAFIIAEVVTKSDLDHLEERINAKIEHSRLLTIIAIGGFNAALLAAAGVVVRMLA